MPPGNGRNSHGWVLWIDGAAMAAVRQSRSDDPSPSPVRPQVGPTQALLVAVMVSPRRVGIEIDQERAGRTEPVGEHRRKAAREVVAEFGVRLTALADGVRVHLEDKRRFGGDGGEA